MIAESKRFKKRWVDWKDFGSTQMLNLLIQCKKRFDTNKIEILFVPLKSILCKTNLSVPISETQNSKSNSGTYYYYYYNRIVTAEKIRQYCAKIYRVTRFTLFINL